MRAKKWLVFLLLIPLLFSASPAPQSAADTLLRLHVRANSDAPADQAVKYQVRDAVLAVLAEHLQSADSAAAAEARVAAVLPAVVAATQETVRAAGFDYQVTAALGRAQFPTRFYGSRIYRAGSYRALQIYLGQGAGQNWWCVLFPPLCFVEAKKTAPEQEAVVMVADGAEDTPPPLKSRLLEWWHKLFGKNEQNLVFGSISAAAPGR